MVVLLLGCVISTLLGGMGIGKYWRPQLDTTILSIANT